MSGPRRGNRRGSARGLLAAVLALCGALPAIRCSGPSGTARASGPPNVVLILLDDLGVGDLGCYGSKEVATPNLDRLAGSGARFTRFYANSSVCSPSRAAILTGCYAERSNLVQVCAPDAQRGLPEEVPTLASWLKRASYATAHVGKWHLGEGSPQFCPTGRGFDESLTSSYDSALNYEDPVLHVNDEEARQFQGHMTRILVDRAIEFVRTNRGRPFYLNLWLKAPHRPFQPPKEQKSRFERTPRGRYLGLIADADEQLGRLLDEIDALSLTHQTIVVAAADNGPPALVSNDETATSDAAEDHEGKGSMRISGVHAPFLMAWPGRIPAGQVIDTPAFGFDLFPTIAALASPGPAPPAMDGVSLAEMLQGHGGPPPPREVFWGRTRIGSEDIAVLSGGYYFLRAGGASALYTSDSLLSADPSNAAQENPDVVRAMEERYDAWKPRVTDLPLARAAPPASAQPASQLETGNDGVIDCRSGGVSYAPDSRMNFRDGDWTVLISFRATGASQALEQVLADREGAWSLALRRTGTRRDDRVRLAAMVSMQDSSGPTVIALQSDPLTLADGHSHTVALTILGRALQATPAALRLVVDGREVATAHSTGFGTPAEGPVRLCPGSGADRRFSGTLERVRLFTGALSDAQLVQGLAER